MRTRRYTAIHKELSITNKSFATLYYISDTIDPSLELYSTKGISDAEWDKVFFIKFVKNYQERLYYFVVENGGKIQIQTMLFTNNPPYMLEPMAILECPLFSSNMSFGYDLNSKGFIFTEGNNVHLILDKFFCGDPLNLVVSGVTDCLTCSINNPN
jgi:hypothetical protein